MHIQHRTSHQTSPPKVQPSCRWPVGSWRAVVSAQWCKGSAYGVGVRRTFAFAPLCCGPARLDDAFEPLAHLSSAHLPPDGSSARMWPLRTPVHATVSSGQTPQASLLRPEVCLCTRRPTTTAPPPNWGSASYLQGVVRATHASVASRAASTTSTSWSVSRSRNAGITRPMTMLWLRWCAAFCSVPAISIRKLGT